MISWKHKQLQQNRNPALLKTKTRLLQDGRALFCKKALLIACGINTYYSKQNGNKRHPQTVRAFIKGWFTLKLLKLKGERNFFGKVFWQCRLKNLIWIVKMCSNMIPRVANLIGCINIYMESINSEKCSHTKISIL